jgi:hypothetical protein
MRSFNSPGAPEPLTGIKLVLGAFGVALATFMIVLDSSIANVAIPTLSGDLGVSVDEGTWVITVFAAANAVVIPLTGWLTQRIGQVKLFVRNVRLGSDAAYFARRTYPTRRGSGTSDTPVASASTDFIFKGEKCDGTVFMGDDGSSRPDCGPGHRRVDHR